MKQKIKYNRKPLIVLLSIAAAFVLAALLCFFIPRMMKVDAPLNLKNNKITMIEAGGYYFLDGTLENVSDETITIKNKGGMEICFRDTNIRFNDSWLLTPEAAEDPKADLNASSSYRDIILLPGETYNFNESTNCFTARASVTKLLVTINGETYNLVRNTYTTNIIMLVSILFAFVFIILAVTQDKNMRNTAIKRNAVLDLCASAGEKSYLLSVIVSDKTESKKAAAKTAGWAVGAVLTTLFTGVGVYSVYTSNTMKDFVLSEHNLYTTNDSNQQGMASLIPVTRNDYPTASIEIKKKKVKVKHVDGKKSLTFIRDKNCELSVEQIAEYLNNVLVKPLPQSEADVFDETATANVDPFDEFSTAQSADTKSLDDGFNDGFGGDENK